MIGDVKMAEIVYVTSVLIDSKPNGAPGSEVTLLLSNGTVLGGLRKVEVPAIDAETAAPVVNVRVQLENPNGDEDDEID